MKVQKIKLSPYDFSWIVLDNNHLPIKPITEFIHYLNNIDKSPFTVRSYAHHLKLYWEFLDAKQLDWTQIKLSGLATFVRSVNHLDDYLKTLNEVLLPSKFNRAFIIGFIQYLAKRGLNPMTRGITLLNIRTLHQIALQEEWLDFPDKQVIFNSDLPKDATITPKYISQQVLNQLKKHLHQLSPWMQNFVTVLMETGRRVSEVSSLTFNCLEQDTGVARSWLYKEPAICELIKNAKGKTNNQLMRDQAILLKAKDKQIEILTKQNKLLRKQIDELRQQLEVTYAAVYKLE
jgi:site-specific recombinase XerD